MLKLEKLPVRKQFYFYFFNPPTCYFSFETFWNQCDLSFKHTNVLIIRPIWGGSITSNCTRHRGTTIFSVFNLCKILLRSTRIVNITHQLSLSTPFVFPLLFRWVHGGGHARRFFFHGRHVLVHAFHRPPTFLTASTVQTWHTDLG